MKDKMISFIVPFFTIEKDKHLNLNEKEDMWPENNSSNIIFSTIKTIKNINTLKCKKEIHNPLMFFAIAYRLCYHFVSYILIQLIPLAATIFAILLIFYITNRLFFLL